MRADPEFEALIPPLSEDERAGLESSILAEGCRDPLVVWKGRDILLDGHHRLSICTAHGIPYTTTAVDLADRDAAKAWIIGAQFSRRNLTPYQRAELALQLEPLIAARAKGNQRRAGGAVPQKSAEAVDTRDELARIAGLSHDTIGKARLIAEKAPEGVKAALRRGETSIHAEHLRLRNPVNRLSSDSFEWYTPAPFIEAAREVMGGIDLDPASCDEANRTVRAERYFDAEADGLSREWRGRVWLNPPYCGLQGPFIRKLIEEHQAGRVPAGVVLVNANSTDTDWFAPLFDYPLCFVHGRINFNSPSTEKTDTTHGSAFAYLGPDVDRFVEVFRRYGPVVRRIDDAATEEIFVYRYCPACGFKDPVPTEPPPSLICASCGAGNCRIPNYPQQAAGYGSVPV